MSLRPAEIAPVPASTAQVAAAAFPKGCPAMRMRDELGAIYDDRDVRLPLPGPRPAGGVPVAAGPGHGAAVRRGAERPAGGRRGPRPHRLEVCAGPGADRPRLRLLRPVRVPRPPGRGQARAGPARRDAGALARARPAQGARRQRTDSTHVLAAVRALNRLELVGETLRAALNALAAVAPDWLRAARRPEWSERYGRRFEESRLPKGEGQRKALASTSAPTASACSPRPTTRPRRAGWASCRPWRPCGGSGCTSTTSRTAASPGGPRRAAAGRLRFDSPYDPDARYGNKRSTTWSRLQGPPDRDLRRGRPHLIIHVETTPAPVPDVAMTAPMHEALAGQGPAARQAPGRRRLRRR